MAKEFITVSRHQFYIGLVIGFLIMLFAGYYINVNQVIGSGILGFGLAMFLLLLEQKLNSMEKIKK